MTQFYGFSEYLKFIYLYTAPHMSMPLWCKNGVEGNEITENERLQHEYHTTHSNTTTPDHIGPELFISSSAVVLCRLNINFLENTHLTVKTG